ncbi:MAG: MBOAT family protein [Clostridia bacterium]|nr:MBOAT family protein [Clostridia bacterium]
MSYSSLSFFIFLAVLTLVYYIAPKRYQWCVLLAASYGFYLTGGVPQLIFIICSTLIAYFAGLKMQSIRDQAKAEMEKAGELTKEEKREWKKRTKDKVHRVQILSVGLTLGILIVVKYTNFGISVLNSVLSPVGAQLPFLNILVPLGISFYSFQIMGYLIDVGRGKYEAERHFGYLALFVSFFPSIVQGPINRYGDIGKQFKEEHKFDYTTVKFGVQLILWGLFKKLVIADRASIAVSAIFNNYINYGGAEYIIATLGYAIQIYADFSGGVDVSIGAAQMLGITLPINFERPYFSTSLAEYWRRWHASLGGWMREYVFYPVMLSAPVTKLSQACRRRGWKYLARIVPSTITPFVVFTLIGVWHGASFKYLAFGLYNATIVAGSVALAPVYKKVGELLRINTETASFKLFGMLRTFFICCIGKTLGHASSLRASMHMIKGMFTDVNLDTLFGLDGTLFALGLDQRSMFVLFIAVLVLFTVSCLQESGMKMRETIARQNLLFRWALYIGIILAILIFGIYGPDFSASEFLYQAY